MLSRSRYCTSLHSSIFCCDFNGPTVSAIFIYPNHVFQHCSMVTLKGACFVVQNFFLHCPLVYLCIYRVASGSRHIPMFLLKSDADIFYSFTIIVVEPEPEWNLPHTNHFFYECSKAISGMDIISKCSKFHKCTIIHIYIISV